MRAPITWAEKLVFKLLILVFFFSCNTEVKVTEGQIRSQFANQLKELPKIQYMSLFGRKPGKTELELGRLLFNDPILARNNDVSCSTCHLANHGFADGIGLSVGALGNGGPIRKNVGDEFATGFVASNREVGDDGFGFRSKLKMFRNTLSTINVAHRLDKDSDSGLLWDGRFGNLFFQVLLPIHTPEELCGGNPLPIDGENVFREGGPLFQEPVVLTHVNYANPYTGKDTNNFNSQDIVVKGVARLRPNGALTVPNRNDCLAIAVAKLNSVPKYREMFEEVYGIKTISDKFIGFALSAFIVTHVSKNTPYDRFVKGESSLSQEQLLGLGVFMTQPGKKFVINGKEHVGAGCINCHTPPQFTDNSFHALGILSDVSSSLSRPTFTGNFRGGFFHNERALRGKLPKCHTPTDTVIGEANYAPDIGRANGSFDEADCFKFRTPTLRNVVETFPYFHHGTEKAQSREAKDFKNRASIALKNAIKYHLRGPINETVFNASNYSAPFYDFLFQRDRLVPYSYLDFGADHTLFPVALSDEDFNGLFEFVATGLLDNDSVKIGDLGNDVSHPKDVPSGFAPINRDEGTQVELPPNGLFNNALKPDDQMTGPK